MKYILIIAILFSLNASAQIDSSRLKASVSLQVRDWLFLNTFLKYNADFDNVYDSMKVKLRVAVAPTLTTVIKVDSVRNIQIIKLAQTLKSGPYGVVIFPYARINAALRVNTYTTTRIDQMDTDYTTLYNQRVQGELDELRSVLQP